MLGACLLGMAAAAQERWFRAAAWLTAATLIKGYPIALVLLLTAFHAQRFAPRFLAALTVGLGFPFLTAPPGFVVGQYASWFAHLRDSTSLMRERLRSIDNLFFIYGDALSPHTFLALQVLAGLFILGCCFIHSCHELALRPRLTMMFSLFTAWAILFGPATETCTYVVIGPAIAWALVEAFGQPAGWLARILLAISLFLMGPIPTDLFGATVRNFANEHGSQPIGAILLLAHLVRQSLWPVQRPSLAMNSSSTQRLTAASFSACFGDTG